MNKPLHSLRHVCGVSKAGLVSDKLHVRKSMVHLVRPSSQDGKLLGKLADVSLILERLHTVSEEVHELVEQVSDVTQRVSLMLRDLDGRVVDMQE